MTLTLVLFAGLAGHAEDQGILEDSALAWRWTMAGGHLSASLENKADGTRLAFSGECFQLQLGDGRVIKATDFQREGVPHTEQLSAEPASPNVARHFAGHRLTREFSDQQDHLTATWQASLRDGTTYLQQELTLRATGGDVWIKAITLFDQPLAEARTVGEVDGSPVVAGTFFGGCENPMAENRVTADHEMSCRLTRNAELKDGETLSEGFVWGVAEPGQMRRGVLAYINAARAHPTRPFLHYNSWFDIAWDKQKFNETQCLDAIDQFGRQRCKADHHLFMGHTQVLDVPVMKWESKSMDLVKMPENSMGSGVLWNFEVNEVLMVTYRATKMVLLLPCHNTMTAVKVARLFLERVVRYHGLLMILVSDKDHLFMSQFGKQL